MPPVKRFEVWLVDLNPTRGQEINKTRPCVVVSPNEMSALSTVLMAPMTTKKANTTLHKTVLKAHNVRFNQGHTEDLFTVRKLEHGP